MNEKAKTLFLCTANSCRSQIAEAWTNRLLGDRFSACSSGVKPKGVDPRAVEAMAHYRRVRDEIRSFVQTLRRSCDTITATLPSIL